MQKYSACRENPFFKEFFCIVTPSLSTSSNKIFVKKGRIESTFYFLSPKGAEEGGGGQSLGEMSPKKLSFFRRPTYH